MTKSTIVLFMNKPIDFFGRCFSLSLETTTIADPLILIKEIAAKRQISVSAVVRGLIARYKLNLVQLLQTELSDS